MLQVGPHVRPHTSFAAIFGSESRNFTTFDATGTKNITMSDIGATTTCIMEAKFATTFSGSIQYICGRHSNDRFYLGLNGTGNPIFGNGSTFFTGLTAMNDGKIHTMRIEVVGSNMLSYLDGSLLDTSPLSWTEVLDDFAIGKQGSAASNYFTGVIYDVKVTSGGVLKRFYKLDETWIGPSTVAVDSGSDGSNGTAVNITSSDSETFTKAGDDWLGVELVTNGGFDTDTNWSKGAGWTISSGSASHAAGTRSTITQNLSAFLTLGQRARIMHDILAGATDIGGVLNIGNGAGNAVAGSSPSVDNTAIVGVGTGTIQIKVDAFSGNNMSVDNLRVARILEGA
jgi:hypothetical protein